MTISGGTPMRTGSIEQPRPPDTIRLRSSSTDVTIGEAVAIARRHARGIAEQPHLAAMGVAGQRERHALGHMGENVGLVRQQDHRRVVRHLGQRAGQIVDALEAAPGLLAPAADQGQLVAEAGQPEGMPILGETHRVVLVDRDAHRLQCPPADHRPLARPLRLAVVPPVVIAEDGVHPERGTEHAQRGRPLAGEARSGSSACGLPQSRPAERRCPA